MAMRLVEAGAELEAANHELDRPLHLAASVGNLEVYISSKYRVKPSKSDLCIPSNTEEF